MRIIPAEDEELNPERILDRLRAAGYTVPEGTVVERGNPTEGPIAEAIQRRVEPG